MILGPNKPFVAMICDGPPVLFHPFPEHGAYFGVSKQVGSDVLWTVPMMADGSPSQDDEGAPDVVFVEYVSDDDHCLDAVNAQFGTAFERHQFA